jgi:menaquinone-dependent protoporphyrinogen oxidase
MKRATKFVRRNCAVLAQHPVWLFSSGPLGTKTIDDQGRDIRTVTVPKEIAEFQEAIHPRDHRVFFGALLATKLGLLHRLIFNMPANKDHALLPTGDFRDWNDIDAWAGEIAEALQAPADGSVMAEPTLSAV